LPLPDEVKSIIEATPDAVAVDTYDPADEETGVGVGDNITLTFNNAMVQENVLLMTDEGVPVAVTKTWDATAKILTVNPDASLTASTTYIVVTDGCVDMYGQLLATETIWFTTAA
jgi:methionine-rich copper-binding protein CopC